jgi:hypothetical protein
MPPHHAGQADFRPVPTDPESVFTDDGPRLTSGTGACDEFEVDLRRFGGGGFLPR